MKLFICHFSAMIMQQFEIAAYGIIEGVADPGKNQIPLFSLPDKFFIFHIGGMFAHNRLAAIMLPQLPADSRRARSRRLQKEIFIFLADNHKSDRRYLWIYGRL